jgi:hypothetical protein
MENHMNVVLVHPIHGAKVATNETEMEQDVKNGWSEYNPDTPVEKPTEAAPAEELHVKRKSSRKVTPQPIEQPNEVPDFLTSASDESEGS